MLFGLLGVLSCKDFKSWESKYGNQVKIAFAPAKDKRVPGALADLQSELLSELTFYKLSPLLTKDSPPFLLKDGLSISLDPNADAVSFELIDENRCYYFQVTICYERMVSLISTEAGGLQVQYTIQEVQCNKKDFFKKITIDGPVPLQAEKEKPNVTLYY
ncbi:hypothetical protein [Cardinium endosymbiont of Sogatella furcifera]|uniref:hypothetical protein n=1 Tax=Cardinium endosymbiont of Sogatella furcifera TaxID=650378 RepID=UPI000E0D1EF6|nr:hypothetical protein [Cardinium endosymbiont of Sogatella furcifera]